MSKAMTLMRETGAAPAAADNLARAPGKDDNAMLKAAASLTRDLNSPSALIYWADMLGSALLGKDKVNEIAAWWGWLSPDVRVPLPAILSS